MKIRLILLDSFLNQQHPHISSYLSSLTRSLAVSVEETISLPSMNAQERVRRSETGGKVHGRAVNHGRCFL